MPETDTVRFETTSLVLQQGKAETTFPAAAIEQILECRMADPVAHGEETFHILLTADSFLLLGPFFPGSLGAIEALRASHPEIPVALRFVGRVPFRYRQPGWLRLFPVPGTGEGPRQDLQKFDLSKGGGEDE